MRFAVLTYGTEGDTRPLAFLCRALMDAGHEARLFADASTMGAAEQLQVPCTPLAGDIRGLLDPAGAISHVVKGSGSLSASARALANIANRSAVSWASTVKEGAADCDAILVGGLAAFVGLSAAEFFRVPAIGLGMIPITPTCEFASPFLPPGRIPRFLNRSSQTLVNQLLWRALRRETNRARTGVYGLAPRRSLWQGHPMLYGVSPQLLPPPKDWPANAWLCGQWVRPITDWSAPPSLLAYLEAGVPPLYVGFGSMQGFDPSSMLKAIVEAVGSRRALFHPGWSGMDPAALPDNFFVLQNAPHDWLFPRVAMAIHHGGSGTSHSACRAGIPSVILPFAGDQAFWADRLADAGVAPRGLRPGATDAGGLRRAIDEATAVGFRERATALGRKMREEDGLATAVALIERLTATEGSAGLDAPAAPHEGAVARRGAKSPRRE
jgi:sterol 3beta-glucosyltransferase